MEPGYQNDERISINRLEKRLDNLQLALGSLITWIAQTAGSPISTDEATRLLKMMEFGEDRDR